MPPRATFLGLSRTLGDDGRWLGSRRNADRAIALNRPACYICLRDWPGRPESACRPPRPGRRRMMTDRTGPEPSERAASRQLRLGEVMLMVAAVGLAAHIIRVGERSQPAWSDIITGLAFRLPVYVAGALGVGLLGVLLIGIWR